MRKLLIGFAAILASQFASAAYLYWQIDSSDYDTVLPDAASVNAARIYQSTDGGTSYSQVNNIYFNATDIGNTAGINPSAPYAIEIADANMNSAQYMYYIELGNYAAASSAWTSYGWTGSYPQSASALYSSGYITSTLEGLAELKIWHGGTVSVPEPTSAMLMLIGAAFLGLKRKNRSIA